MYIYVNFLHGTKQKTIAKLNGLKRFKPITPLGKNTLKLETKTPVYEQNKNTIEKILAELKSIKTLFGEMKVYPFLNISAEKLKRKLIHIFADVDSTVTHNGINAPNRNLSSFIQKIKKHKANFYFCTGRSYQDVEDLIKAFDTGKYGIAENGGYGGMYHRLVLEKPVNNEATE